MKLDEFVALVKQMREMQKTYFRMRRQQDSRQDELSDVLSRSKELERRVDKAVDDITSRQGNLKFPDWARGE